MTIASDFLEFPRRVREYGIREAFDITLVQLRYEIMHKGKEDLLIWLADKLPNEFVRWVYIRVAVYATTGPYRDTVVPELGMMEALKRWDDD